ncbi:MAG TPA: phosphoribosyltransferase family protein [Erysipelotrichaceae bacterium]|nr:phosphoribosyltransferase family protein [Erysipelotrichaceae bacterium]
MKSNFKLNVAGLTRELPILRLNDTLSIASFVLLGDTELVVQSAPLLAEKLPDLDILVGAEAKGIPLVHELSRILNKERYVIARKSIKPYMGSAVIDEVLSITTQVPQILALDEMDAKRIKGKRIGLIDDVISTGASLSALERLVEQAGGIIVAKAAILAEGDAANRADIIYLEKLPLFWDK